MERFFGLALRGAGSICLEFAPVKPAVMPRRVPAACSGHALGLVPDAYTDTLLIEHP